MLWYRVLLSIFPPFVPFSSQVSLLITLDWVVTTTTNTRKRTLPTIPTLAQLHTALISTRDSSASKNYLILNNNILPFTTPYLLLQLKWFLLLLPSNCDSQSLEYYYYVTIVHRIRGCDWARAASVAPNGMDRMNCQVIADSHSLLLFEPQKNHHTTNHQLARPPPCGRYPYPCDEGRLHVGLRHR